MKSPVIMSACSDLQHTRTFNTGLKMKSPDVNSGDQVIRDRRSKHIAEDEGDADYEGGRRDHREGVRRHPNSPIPVKIALQVSYALSSIMHK